MKIMTCCIKPGNEGGLETESEMGEINTEEIR